MNRCDQRNRLGLPFGMLHEELLKGTLTTTYDAVHDFIETPTEALKRQATDVKRLCRRAGGRQAGLQLAACQHTKANGLSSGCFACASIFRRWALPQAVAFSQRDIETTVVVPLIKEVPLGELHRVNLHHRVMLAICHAFTGPVVDLIDLEAPAIQLVGEASVFKSSLCSIIALMWGMRPKSWHATDNGGEDVALARHASHLVLDDLRVDGKHSYVDLRAYAIRLTDGRSKERRDEPGRTFRTPILSSSNRSLDEHARLAGLSMDVDQAALRGRLIDVPLVNGRTQLFEVLHGRPSARDLIKEMSDIAKENAGVPAVEFVARLQRRLCEDGEALRQALTTARAFYETGAGAAFEDVPGYDLTRVHGRFATIYAAGDSLSTWGCCGGVQSSLTGH